MKHEVTATFKPCPAETFQVTVKASTGWTMDEVRAQAVRAVHDLVAGTIDIYAQRDSAELTGEAEA